MAKPLFTRQTFAVPGARKAALLFAGYRGNIASLRPVVHTLNDRGFTVIAYEHSPHAIRSGNPADLLRLLDEIYQDVLPQLDIYEGVICTGVSVGAGLGFSLQRRLPKRLRQGIYAGAGVSPSETIFGVPLFYFARRAFRRRGYDAAALYKEWQVHEITASTPLPVPVTIVMALGQRDMVVHYRKALATLHAWQHAGTPITIISKQCGHGGIIRWYKRHLGELLDASLLLHP